MNLKWEKGFETLALMAEEWTEHDKPSKRYDWLGQLCDKYLNELRKSSKR